MTKKNTNIIIAKRPLEYVAFFSFRVPTKEGPGYVFMAVDGYSAYAFQLAVEKDESETSVLKNIYFLLEQPDFLKYIEEGFTLVFGKYEDYASQINTVVKIAGGKIIFNKEMNTLISLPVIQSLGELLNKYK